MKTIEEIVRSTAARMHADVGDSAFYIRSAVHEATLELQKENALLKSALIRIRDLCQETQSYKAQKAGSIATEALRE